MAVNIGCRFLPVGEFGRVVTSHGCNLDGTLNPRHHPSMKSPEALWAHVHNRVDGVLQDLMEEAETIDVDAAHAVRRDACLTALLDLEWRRRLDTDTPEVLASQYAAQCLDILRRLAWTADDPDQTVEPLHR